VELGSLREGRRDSAWEMTLGEDCPESSLCKVRADPQRLPWREHSQVGFEMGLKISNIARDVGSHTGAAVGKCG